MIVTTTITVDIQQAKRMLIVSCGNQSEADKIEHMTEDEIVTNALKHCSGWGIKEKKGD